MSIIPFSRGNGARLAAAFLLVALAMPLSVAPADARLGGGASFGSRGARTFNAPAFTPTAPRYVQPLQRSDTPAFGTTQTPRFGFGSGLLAGLLGAGLMGSMFGGGFFSGIAALIGLMVKLALIGGVIWLIVRFMRGRGRAAPMTAGGPDGYARMPLDGGLPGGAPGGGTTAGRRPPGGPATIGPQDYAAFEQALVALQAAFSREDTAALSRLATPEILRSLEAELEANRRRGQRNDVSQTRLVAGDLSEAWTEGAATYATVAMRFAAIDVMIDRASGRIAAGDPVRPVEAVELWTFRREGRGGWLLAALQQGG